MNEPGFADVDCALSAGDDFRAAFLLWQVDRAGTIGPEHDRAVIERVTRLRPGSHVPDAALAWNSPGVESFYGAEIIRDRKVVDATRPESLLEYRQQTRASFWVENRPGGVWETGRRLQASLSCLSSDMMASGRHGRPELVPLGEGLLWEMVKLLLASERDEESMLGSFGRCLGRLYESRGELRNALVAHEWETLAMEREYGEDHPDMQPRLLTHATLLDQLGDLPGATVLRDRAAGVWNRRASCPNCGPTLVVPLIHVGILEYEKQTKPEAEYHVAGCCTMNAPRWRCRRCGTAWPGGLPELERGPRRPA